MSYREIIIDFLKERKDRRFTAAQIVYFLSPLGLSESVVFANLKKMREQKEIGYDHARELSGHSHPVMVYWWKDDTTD
mgnify:CR=1 FL=1